MADWLGDHPELYNKKLNCLLIFCLQLLHMQQLLHDDQISVIICHSVELSTVGLNCLKTFIKLKIEAENRGFYTTK